MRKGAETLQRVGTAALPDRARTGAHLIILLSSLLRDVSKCSPAPNHAQCHLTPGSWSWGRGRGPGRTEYGALRNSAGRPQLRHTCFAVGRCRHFAHPGSPTGSKKRPTRRRNPSDECHFFLQRAPLRRVVIVFSLAATACLCHQPSADRQS